MRARIRLTGIVMALACAIMTLLALPAAAQPARNHIAAELLAELVAGRADALNLWLHFTPEPGWHGYWRNPGDAGFGMELEWRLPAGWTAGEALYPVPQQLLIGGLMNHVYEADYAILIPLSLPRGGAGDGPHAVEVVAHWLACTDRVCVPEQAVLKADILPRMGAGDARFDRWRAAIPPLLGGKGTFALAGDKLRLAIPLPASMDVIQPHVFIATEELVDYAAAQGFSRKGDRLIAEVPLRGGARPRTVEGIVSFGEGEGLRFAAVPGAVPADGAPLSEPPAPAGSYWLLVLGALAGGLILNIMPCVFPVLSLKAISLARAGESQAQARAEGLAYTAGVVLACLALGGVLLALRAAGAQLGWAFQLQDPGVVVALLLLAVAITANLGGLFELPSLSITRSGEPASAFATGLLAAFVATPCTGPFMAAAMGAALLLPPVQALALFAALGLGLALPFLALGFVPALRAMLPRPGTWMEGFRHWMAAPMGLTALALLWLASRLGGKGFALVALIVAGGLLIALMVAGRLQRADRMAWPAFGLVVTPFLTFGAFALPASLSAPAKAQVSLPGARTFSEAGLSEARASGQPVFLWFTADWCVTCKVNESVAIEREATRAAFAEAGVIPMVGDWTRRDPAITRFLTAHGAAGVPLYLWYPPGGEARQLPQVLGPDSLVELVSQAGGNAPAAGPAGANPPD